MAITYINSTQREQKTAAVVYTFTLPAFNCAANNLVVVGISAGDATSVTDTAGNTYVQALTLNGTSRGIVEVWYCLKTTAHASNVITVNFGGIGGGYIGICATQYSGGDAGTFALDQIATGTGVGSTSITTGTFTTTRADEVIVGYATQAATSATLTAGSGYTKRVNTGSGADAIQDKIVSEIQTSVTSSISSSVTFGLTLGVATFYFIPTRPTVDTDPVDNIDLTTARARGEVVFDGGNVITERGFCWNTTGTPTTGDTKVVVSGTTGIYSGTLTGLSTNTLHYVRAYAINSVATSYGEEVSFTTLGIAAKLITKDISGVEGQIYAVRLYVGGTTGTVTVTLGSTGATDTFAAGAGYVTLQGVYSGLTGLIIEASETFDGYIDDVSWVLILGDATINWSLDTLTNVFPINSSVLFRRIEDKDFNKFRIYRILDIKFKDLDAYVTVELKKEANESLETDSKQFLVSNTSSDTLPFINKKLSMLTKNQAIRIGVSNNRLSETFTVCQLIIKGYDQSDRLFKGSKIINMI